MPPEPKAKPKPKSYGLCKGVRAIVKDAAGKDISDRFEPAIIEASEGDFAIGLKTVAAHTPAAGETITVKFDRDAYHREYMRTWMRKHRAKLKEAKE